MKTLLTSILFSLFSLTSYSQSEKKTSLIIDLNDKISSPKEVEGVDLNFKKSEMYSVLLTYTRELENIEKAKKVQVNELKDKIIKQQENIEELNIEALKSKKEVDELKLRLEILEELIIGSISLYDGVE